MHMDAHTPMAFEWDDAGTEYGCNRALSDMETRPYLGDIVDAKLRCRLVRLCHNGSMQELTLTL